MQEDSRAPDLAEPNIIAYLMLLIWPVVALQLYTRLDPARALIWTILGGYLVLPPIAAFAFPVVPDFDKSSIPNLMALLLSVLLLKDRINFLPAGVVGRVLIVMFVMTPLATVLTNGDPIHLHHHRTIPAMQAYDSLAVVTNQLIYLLPFFLARRYLATPEALRLVLTALVAAGLIYSIPMLIESRLSPQINIWVYGFFQHDFSQSIRGGGYRPVVFLQHGLWVAFFALMALASSLVILRRATPEERPRMALIVLWLAIILVLCRSLGPMVYAAALVPILLVLPRRLQILIAALLACIVITYPLLRGAHLIPLDDILAFANAISSERGQSLEYRITNEEILLNRAAERPWFGWGGYARNLVHDIETGELLTIADGEWILRIGSYGWLGYITEFGLLALPLLALAREALAKRDFTLSPWACGLALILAFNMVDMLPNATLIPFTWLLAGALLGYAEQLVADRRAKRHDRWLAALDPRPQRTVI